MDGTRFIGRELGNSSSLARVGTSNAFELPHWIDNANSPKNYWHRLYALSQELTVPPTSPCDFDNSGTCGLADINELLALGDLVAGVLADPNSRFDLNSDNSIDNTDIAEWLRLAGANNGYGGGDPSNPNGPLPAWRHRQPG